MSEEEKTFEQIINEREVDRFLTWDQIDAHLPMTMDNGYVITSPLFNCTVCDQLTLFGDAIRGELRTCPNGHVRLTGYGFCSSCKSMSTLRQHYIQSNDGMVEIHPILRPEPIPLAGADIIPFEKPKKKRRRVNGEEIKSSNTG